VCVVGTDDELRVCAVEKGDLVHFYDADGKKERGNLADLWLAHVYASAPPPPDEERGAHVEERLCTTTTKTKRVNIQCT
jgi:hypothetical protein